MSERGTLVVRGDRVLDLVLVRVVVRDCGVNLGEREMTDTVRDLFRGKAQLVPRGDALNRHTCSGYDGTTTANGWVASNQASDVDGRAHEGIVKPPAAYAARDSVRS